MRGDVAFLLICFALASPAFAGSPVALSSQARLPDARVKTAIAAAEKMRDQLLASLLSALNNGGPQSAIAVCAEIAPAIAASMTTQKLEIGRTSTRLRNKKNAPRPWAEPLLIALEDQPADQRGPLTASLPDGSLGVVLPIVTAKPCLQCHGTDISPEVKRALAARYPKDTAVGFREGDLRGAFWVEVKTPPAAHRYEGVPHHRFDDAAAWAERFDDPTRDAWQLPDEVIKALALAPDAIVADLGAGTGYFSVRLARALSRGRVLAIDVEPHMVEWIAARAQRDGLKNIEGIVATTHDPKLNANVDLILVVDTYHHIADRPAYFARLRNKLKVGGRIAIVDFTPDSPRGPPRQHKLPASTVTAEMASAGFAPVATHTFLPDQYFLVFSRR